MFIAAVGADNEAKNEIHPALLARSRLVTDLTSQASRMGDLHHALAAGAMRLDQVHAELAQILAGVRPGRENDGQAPGPLAAQLCFYIGYVRGGVTGAPLAGLAFVLPSFLLVLGLGAAYVRFGGLPWMQAVFYGVGAAVIGLITRSAATLVRRTLADDPLHWALALMLMVTTAATERESATLIVLAGVVAWLVRAPPRWIGRGGIAAEAASLVLLAQIFGFFTYAGAFVFGSGLAIVPFLRGGVVQQYQWLGEAEFLDAVAVAMITPGPVVITTGFIGYLVADLPGAVLAAVATFLPCFVLTVVPAPWFHRHGSRPGLQALVAGITAASIGALCGAVIVLGRGALRDWPTAGLALLSLGLSLRVRWLADPLIVAGAAVAGLLLRG